VRRYERRLFRYVLAINYGAVGGLTIYMWLALRIYPNVKPRDQIIFEFARLAIPLLILATAVGAAISRRTVRRVLNWLPAGREPTEVERTLTFSLPRRTATLGTVLWIVCGTALLFYMVFVVHGVPRPLVVKAWGALVVSPLVPWSMSYVLCDRALRPVYALAITSNAQNARRTIGIVGRLVLAWIATSAVPVTTVLLVLFGLDEAHLARAAPAMFAALIASSLGGAVVAVFWGHTLVEPINAVRRGLRAVAQGDLDVQLPVADTNELGELELGFNSMVAGLRERERIRDLFGRHVGPEIVRRAVGGNIALGGERRSVTAMFVDVIGSTALTQSRRPEDVVVILNAFFDAVVRCVSAEGGLVNKFQGDGALCIFGAPDDLVSHAASALRAAQSLRSELLSVDEDVDAGIGISSGEVVAGNVGAADRYEYTIIGDAVNEAARLTDHAKTMRSRVLVSESTVKLAGSEAELWSPVGTIELRGRAGATVAYELA
jgi:adenylate cyclase